MESEGVMERVRSLIEQDPECTQEQFAHLVGIDPTKLSKSLNSKRRFTSLELAQIAQYRGVTVDWLLTGQGESMAARFSDKSTGDVAHVIEEARRIAEARGNLALILQKPSLPPPPVLHSSIWIEQGEELAEFALKHLGRPNVSGETETFASAIERSFNIDVRVMDTNGACDGLAYHLGDARVMVVATSQRPTRQRFTMAHELCHLICDDDQAGLHVDTDIDAAASRKGKSEVRANVFAAALLMPRTSLESRMPPEAANEDSWFQELCLELMVSPSALSWRLFNLKMINETDRRRLGRGTTVSTAAAIGRLSDYTSWLEASEGARVPTGLIGDVLAAYLAGETTLQPLANLLQADIEEVRNAIEGSETGEDDELVL